MYSAWVPGVHLCGTRVCTHLFSPPLPPCRCHSPPQELHAVAHVVAPHLEALVGACQAYHLFTPDGWISTGGFMTAARKAGLQLSRAEFLALERALTKDSMGRINFLQLQELVGSIMGAAAAGEQ